MNTQLSAKELEAKLQAGNCELIDVREPLEWAGARISGAKLYPLDSLAGEIGSWDKEKEYVVMCKAGPRGSRAAKLMRENGFENVSELDGGITSWQRAGLAVEKDKKAPWPLERQVFFVASLLLLTGLIGSSWVPGLIFLTWFVSAGLLFASVTGFCGMALLLAKAPWNKIDIKCNCSE